ncbi:MAG TPA: SRPBCC family protein [Amycolatopsis sp.]|nr:SRPBCC family protein [Amycolatopsis sp.]
MAETTSGSAKVTLPADNQILITREFAAPPHLVYRAWTTPEMVKHWWAGRRGTMTSVEIDLRTGGRWRYVMTANGGFEVAFHGVFREIVPARRIVTTEVFEMPGEQADEDAAVTTTTFMAVGDRTRLELLTETRTKEIRDAIIDSGMEGGMQEQMDALDDLAASLG